MNIGVNEKIRYVSIGLNANTKMKASSATIKIRDEGGINSNIYDKENKYSMNNIQNNFKKSIPKLRLDVVTNASNNTNANTNTNTNANTNTNTNTNANTNANAQTNRNKYFENDLRTYTEKSLTNRMPKSNLVGSFQSTTSRNFNTAEFNAMIKSIKR